MAEVMSHFTGGSSSYAPGIETHGGVVSRPVPPGFRTWLPAIVVLLCTPMMALTFAKSGLLSSKHGFVHKAPAALKQAADQGTGAIYYAKVSLSTSEDRSGFRSLALICGSNSSKTKVDENEATLSRLASIALRDTTVSDLDIPGALEAKRADLLTKINDALGGQIVQEVYIAEWPRQ